jgi:arylsulfatase A-like enzyme
VDKQVGRLLDYLEEEGLFENTIIILSADHGEILERRHDYLRHGFGVYEEEVRVPLMIYFPGFGHQVIEERIRGIDMVPTVLDIGGFNLSEEFQGSVMSEGQDIFLSAQNQNFKLGLIRGDIKYMMNWISFIPEAYNLTEDPHELNNLIKNEKDEKFYYRRYGYLLIKWYKCQMKYYKKEMWKKGKTIEC